MSSSGYTFLHAADLHLDSPLRGLERYEGAPVDEIRGATRRALENLVRTALEERVAFIVIAGDLYDGDWPDAGPGLFFVGQMRRLREAGIPVYLIRGNHDAASRLTRELPLPDNVRLLDAKRPETVLLPDLDVALHGQSFATQHVHDNLAAAYPAAIPGCFNLGLLHTGLSGEDPVHEPYAPCSVDGLRSKRYDYWALGHIHQPATLHQDPWIIFPGNTQGRHARETGPKGCVLIDVEDRCVQAVRSVILDVVRWEECPMDATGLIRLDDLYGRFRHELLRLIGSAEGRMLALRVRITGATDLHRKLLATGSHRREALSAIAQDVGGGTVWLEKIKVDTRLPRAAQEGREETLAEIRSYVAELCADPAALASLGQELDDLITKLPAGMAEELQLLAPERIRAALSDAETLLTDRLLAREEGA